MSGVRPLGRGPGPMRKGGVPNSQIAKPINLQGQLVATDRKYRYRVPKPGREQEPCQEEFGQMLDCYIKHKFSGRACDTLSRAYQRCAQTAASGGVMKEASVKYNMNLIIRAAGKADDPQALDAKWKHKP